MQVLKNYFLAFIDLLFPTSCLICSRGVEAKEILCPFCTSQLPIMEAKEFDAVFLHQKFLYQNKIRSLYCFLQYEQGNITQQLLYFLKYRHSPHLGNWLGIYCGEYMMNSRTFSAAHFIIIPVPLSKKILKKRGYNQSEYFAKGLSKSLGIPCNMNVLKRVKDTIQQAKTSREQRWKSIKNAFEVCEPDRIKNKNILLVDDVLTTGSTVEACTLALFDFVVSIEVVTIAYV